MKLRTSADSAIIKGKAETDLIVILGDLFPELHARPGVDISFPVNGAFLQKNNSIRVFGGEKGIPLIFQILMDDYRLEDFLEAFELLQEMMMSHPSQLVLLQYVTFTSSALYSSEFEICVVYFIIMSFFETA